MQTVKLDKVLTAARRGAALFTAALLLSAGIPGAEAKQKPSELQIIPAVTGISLNDAGDLVASGTATVQKKNGITRTFEFSDVPVSLALAADQTGAGTCPILDLMLGPIDLNVLGLVIHLDRVVLDITAEQGPGNLLGNLLCAVAGLLDPPTGGGGGGLSGLLNSIIALLNQILGQL